jgi:hypothetical protein
VAIVRDGLRLWYKSSAPKHFVPQKYEPDSSKKEKIRLTLLKALARRYLEYGDVLSLSQCFAVLKGEEDIQKEYRRVAADLFIYIDDFRPTAPSEQECW